MEPCAPLVSPPIVPEVLAYVAGEDRWYELPPMPSPRWKGRAVTLADGRILIVGGMSGVDTPFEATREVWIYAP